MCRLYLFTVLHTINFTVALIHSKSIFVILHREVSSYLFIAPTHTLTSTSCSQLLCMIIFFRSRLDYTWIDSCRRSFSCVFYFRLEVRCFFLRKPVGLLCLFFFVFFFKFHRLNSSSPSSLCLFTTMCDCMFASVCAICEVIYVSFSPFTGTSARTVQ